MNKYLFYLTVLIVMIFAIISITIPVFAQSSEAPDPGGVILESGEAERPFSAQEFGIQDAMHTWIPAEAFHQRGTTDWGYASSGYIYRTGGSNWFMAPVNLPSGVDIMRIQLHCYDNNASEDIAIWYTKYDVINDAYYQSRGNITSGTPGKQIINFDPYYLDPQLHIFDNQNIYSIYVDLPATDNSLQFMGVRITYFRTISAPPATSTFSDVSTTMQFFPYIEALAASGITTGYGDGTFRPDQGVTRGQMAAFLARALGLHHHDSWEPWD